jgi:hypothetical protein
MLVSERCQAWWIKHQIRGDSIGAKPGRKRAVLSFLLRRLMVLKTSNWLSESSTTDNNSIAKFGRRRHWLLPGLSRLLGAAAGTALAFHQLQLLPQRRLRWTASSSALPAGDGKCCFCCGGDGIVFCFRCSEDGIFLVEKRRRGCNQD